MKKFYNLKKVAKHFRKICGKKLTEDVLDSAVILRLVTWYEPFDHEGSASNLYDEMKRQYEETYPGKPIVFLSPCDNITWNEIPRKMVARAGVTSETHEGLPLDFWYDPNEGSLMVGLTVAVQHPKGLL